MIYDIKIAKQIAKYLLEKKAVILSSGNPFTWASGWKTPIYCDNRVLLSYPEVRTFIKKQFAAIVQDKFPDIHSIAGVATAGISHAALVADELQLPMAYVRAKAKDHGTKNLIEGRMERGSKVLVVEDLISTGGSSLGAVKNLIDNAINVQGLIAIFSYAFPVAERRIIEMKLKCFILCDYNVLLEEALHMKYINESELGLLREWREDPESWTKKFEN
jgi:orotate phosphoribosyltransferase